MKDRAWIALLAAAVLSGVVAGGWWFRDRLRGNGIPRGFLVASGRIEARDVRVSAATGGRVLRLVVREGQAVDSGQLIAEIDRRAPETATAGAAAAAAAADQGVIAADRRVAAIEAQLSLAKLDAERYAQLAASGSAPRQAAERAAATFAQLESEARAARAGRALAAQQARAARAQSRAADIQLGETRVYAPLSGVVADALVREGEIAAPGAPIVRLRRRDEVTLRVYLPFADAQRVRVGMEARAYAEGLGDRPVTGHVATVASEAEFTPNDVHVPDDRTTLVFAVVLHFANAGETLKDGFPADAYIRADPAAPWPAKRPWK